MIKLFNRFAISALSFLILGGVFGAFGLHLLLDLSLIIAGILDLVAVVILFLPEPIS